MAQAAVDLLVQNTASGAKSGWKKILAACSCREAPRPATPPNVVVMMSSRLSPVLILVLTITREKQQRLQFLDATLSG